MSRTPAKASDLKINREGYDRYLTDETKRKTLREKQREKREKKRVTKISKKKNSKESGTNEGQTLPPPDLSSVLSPTQLAAMFPDYYKEPLPSIQGLLATDSAKMMPWIAGAGSLGRGGDRGPGTERSSAEREAKNKKPKTAKELIAERLEKSTGIKREAFNELGDVTAKYESGNSDVGTISSGVDDPGGVSYGRHQLSSAKGTMSSFLNSPEGEKYKANFEGLTPGTPAFNEAYSRIANSDSKEDFGKAQKSFIKRTHYDPLEKYARERGWDTKDPRVQEALFSMSVQHGGAKKIIDAAGDVPGTPEEQVRELYRERAEYVKGLGLKSERSILNRYEKEVEDVLEIPPESEPPVTKGADGMVKGEENYDLPQDILDKLPKDMREMYDEDPYFKKQIATEYAMRGMDGLKKIGEMPEKQPGNLTPGRPIGTVDGMEYREFEGAERGPGAADEYGVYDAPANAGESIVGTSNRAEIEENLVPIETASGATFNVHRKVAGNMKAFVRELESMGYYIDPGDKSAGAFNYRNKNNGSGLSEHSFGTAIDLNPNTNHDSLAHGDSENNLPPNVAEIAKKYGLSAGILWNREDSMHFEAHPSHEVPFSENIEDFDEIFKETVKANPDVYVNASKLAPELFPEAEQTKTVEQATDEQSASLTPSAELSDAEKYPRFSIGKSQAKPGQSPELQEMWDGAVDESQMKPEFLDVMRRSSNDLPEGWHVKVISGKREGTPVPDGKGGYTIKPNDAVGPEGWGHDDNEAMDIVITDPEGNRVPHDKIVDGTKIYEKFYRSMYIRAKEMYPDQDLIWGRNFKATSGDFFDPMHYELLGKDDPHGAKEYFDREGHYTMEDGVTSTDPRLQVGALSKEERDAFDAHVRTNMAKEKQLAEQTKQAEQNDLEKVDNQVPVLPVPEAEVQSSSSGSNSVADVPITTTPSSPEVSSDTPRPRPRPDDEKTSSSREAPRPRTKPNETTRLYDSSQDNPSTLATSEKLAESNREQFRSYVPNEYSPEQLEEAFEPVQNTPSVNPEDLNVVPEQNMAPPNMDMASNDDDMGDEREDAAMAQSPQAQMNRGQAVSRRTLPHNPQLDTITAAFTQGSPSAQRAFSRANNFADDDAAKRFDYGATNA